MNQFETLIHECDGEIRQGRHQDAAKRLQRLNAQKIPREWRLPLAKLCRRAGLYLLGLRVLSRVVNPSRKQENPTSPAESAEYAALLLRCGAINEALERLGEINTVEAPEADLFAAYAHFSKWEYPEAVPYLERYLRAPLSSAAFLLGRSNLAIAYVESRQHQHAAELIRENLVLARRQNHPHLEAYNHALMGQIHLQENDLAAARQEIDLAQGRPEADASNDQFFVTKLKLILDGLESNRLEPLNRLRTLADAKGDWFTLREADVFSLKIQFDLARFLHLFFGSPLEGFRRYVCHELNHVPERKTYVLGPKSAPRFDLKTGVIDGKTKIRAGGECHQLIEILLRDFYQPLRVTEIYSALFPNERFNVESSPGRVRQVIRRTRRWLEENQIPVSLREREGYYSLSIDGNFSFRVPLARTPIDLFTQRLEKLSAIYKNATFSARDACRALELSTMTVYRLLTQAIESGLIENGHFAGSKGYRFTPQKNLIAG